jgi:hypothetical protein
MWCPRSCVKPLFITSRPPTICGPSRHRTPRSRRVWTSLGPIFGELREAGRELLELRRRCYEQQADNHADMAHNLRMSATMWDQHEEEAARNLGGIIDGGR